MSRACAARASPLSLYRFLKPNSRCGKILTAGRVASISFRVSFVLLKFSLLLHFLPLPPRRSIAVCVAFHPRSASPFAFSCASRYNIISARCAAAHNRKQGRTAIQSARIRILDRCPEYRRFSPRARVSRCFSSYTYVRLLLASRTRAIPDTSIKIYIDGPDGYKYYFYDLRKDKRIFGSVMFRADIAYGGETQVEFIDDQRECRLFKINRGTNSGLCRNNWWRKFCFLQH